MGTGNQSQAIRQARIVAYDFERALRGEPEVAVNRAQIVSLAVVAPAIAMVPHDTPSLQGPPEKTLRDLLDMFLSDPSKARSEKTRMVYENAIAVAGELIGLDTPLCSVDREGCRRLLDMLRWLPSIPTKRFPKLTAVQASEMAKAKKLNSTLSHASIHGDMNRLSAMMNFAVNEGYIDRNPARGLRVADPIHRRDRRLPFTSDQLQVIFNAPLYRGCVDDESGYADVGAARPRRARFWAPLIALYGDMRLNEILQLDLADIRQVDGADCFLISSRSVSGTNDKRVKTTNSERYVPIHPRLVEIGFMDFAEGRRAGSGTKLFPDLQISTMGYYSEAFSKRFRRFVAKSGAAQAKTCFHSFRHNFRDGLREARGIDHDVALTLGGWASGTGKESAETAEAYGRGFRVATLSEALKQIEYPNLDLSHLCAGR